MNKVIRPAVKAAIIKNGKILLLKKPKSIHKGFIANDIPGGKIEFEETDYTDALKREVKEEIGTDIEVVKPVCMATIVKSDNLHIVGTVFLCKMDGNDINLSDEHEGFEWTELGNVLKDNYPEWIKDIVRTL